MFLGPRRAGPKTNVWREFGARHGDPSSLCYHRAMCRSIKQLRRPTEDATDEEISAAALQFVRKVSGYRQPSRANAEAFDTAVAEIATASKRLLGSLQAGKRA